jgi:ketosteroid isomerase-like protein
MSAGGKKVSGDPVQPIFEVQHRWVEALAQADIATLDDILLDSYVDTDESGCRLAKPAILAALKSGDLKLESITLLETQVHRHGNSAVLIGTSAQTGALHGKPIAPKILFTAFMVLRNRKWKAVAAHRTAVPS